MIIDSFDGSKLKQGVQELIKKELNEDVRIEKAVKLGNKACLIQLKEAGDKTRILQKKNKLRFLKEDRMYINHGLTDMERSIQKGKRNKVKEVKDERKMRLEYLDQNANVSQHSEAIQEIEDISDQLPSCSSISQMQAFDSDEDEVQGDSRKLSSTSSSKSVKDLNYEKKTILVAQEIKKNRMEQQDILNRREREQVAHKKQMELLELEIQIKKIMLNKSFVLILIYLYITNLKNIHLLIIL
nr:unnamed protein product [Callosobruchus analis]